MTRTTGTWEAAIQWVAGFAISVTVGYTPASVPNLVEGAGLQTGLSAQWGSECGSSPVGKVLSPKVVHSAAPRCFFKVMCAFGVVQNGRRANSL